MLDLTAAFNTVDHSILISRLARHVGLQGSVLQWFSSYLMDRTFAVMLDDHSSLPASLSSGVPQESILGPVLFSLYMLPLGAIIAKHNLSFHLYADDIQLYLPVLPNAASALDSLHSCLSDIKHWLAQNFLHLNENQTEYILFAPSDLHLNILSGSSLSFPVSNTVKNLGVIFDSELRFDRQIVSIVKASFFQLRLLTKVKPFLSKCDLEKAIHTFISSCIDYCNALYFGATQSSLRRLQLVQNAAAHLLTRTSRHTHITPILSALHWLPVHHCIEFKILTFVFKALHGLAPLYISELLTIHRPSRALRSSTQMVLDVPRSRYKQWGDRCFAVAAPTLALPLELRVITNLQLFKSRLKTYLFRRAFES
uniref:Reverse transcriptase domain-containing protein n=1 Tax=Amphiprion percula TaxID=161767 RepID=A0A3P8U7G5_AMPPE